MKKRGWEYVIFSLAIGLMLVLVDCQGDSKETPEEPGILTNSYLAIGERFKFSDDWELQFECDCCYNEIHFDSDSTFTLTSPCLHGCAAYRGNYKIIENRVILDYDGLCVYTETQFEEADSGMVERIMDRDTIFEPWKENWRIDTLESQVVLTNSKAETVLKGLVLNESQIHWICLENVPERFNTLVKTANER